ncbi:hypothetical protein NPIL_526461 [Nephila pilipes]|uniref:Uncharacterized protein n=1 Tax=Nephila pilipes TaxID=299642 RepID=A0A8X6MLN9_NEPPI|nr:hypothetical protein NPIL_526461 [Nephila pilipes]
MGEVNISFKPGREAGWIGKHSNQTQILSNKSDGGTGKKPNTFKNRNKEMPKKCKNLQNIEFSTVIGIQDLKLSILGPRK